jgi:hypothetical protein
VYQVGVGSLTYRDARSTERQASVDAVTATTKVHDKPQRGGTFTVELPEHVPG